MISTSHMQAAMIAQIPMIIIRTIELLMLKKRVLDHLLNEKLAKLPLGDEAKSIIKAKCSSVSSYRQGMGEAYFDEQGVFHAANTLAEAQWRGAVGRLGEKFVCFVEEACFQQKLDGTLKLALIHSKTVPETLDMEAMAERWNEIENRAAAPPQNPPLNDEEDHVAESFMPDNVIIPDISQKLSEAEKESVAEAVKEAQRVVNQGVKLIDASEKNPAIMEQLIAHPINHISGAAGFVLVVYDVKASGEDPRFATSMRGPPLRKAQVKPNSDNNMIDSE